MNYTYVSGIWHGEKKVFISHVIEFEPANKEGLLQMTKMAILRTEVVDWLKENISGSWLFIEDLIAFEILEEAMAFKLRWI